MGGFKNSNDNNKKYCTLEIFSSNIKNQIVLGS